MSGVPKYDQTGSRRRLENGCQNRRSGGRGGTSRRSVGSFITKLPTDLLEVLARTVFLANRLELARENGSGAKTSLKFQNFNVEVSETSFFRLRPPLRPSARQSVRWCDPASHRLSVRQSARSFVFPSARTSSTRLSVISLVWGLK